MLLAVMHNPLDGVMADAVERTKHHVRPGQQRGKPVSTLLSPAIMVDETAILPFHKRAEMTALSVSATNVEDAAFTQINILRARATITTG